MSCEVTIDPGVHEVGERLQRPVATVCVPLNGRLLFTPRPGSFITELMCSKEEMESGRTKKMLRIEVRQTYLILFFFVAALREK